MRGFELKIAVLMLIAAATCMAPASTAAQTPPVKSQEISEVDGVPVLLKHLPRYEDVRSQAVLVSDKRGLMSAAGPQPVLDLMEFPFGTEAAVARYPEGGLVLIEYTNPQASVEADGRVQQFLAGDAQAGFVYRRIGNYNAFVFLPSDAVSANALLDQIKYEKTVQWLGENPYIVQQLERYLVTTSRDIMISTVLVIVLGLATALLTGIAVGFVFFRVRDQRRASRRAFSDAGGLTRLNLDGLSDEL